MSFAAVRGIEAGGEKRVMARERRYLSTRIPPEQIMHAHSWRCSRFPGYDPVYMQQVLGVRSIFVQELTVFYCMGFVRYCEGVTSSL